MNRPRRPRPLEREVQRSVLRALAALGCDPERRNIRRDPVRQADGSKAYVKSGRAGMPDVTATVPGLGTRLEVEVKRPGERPTRLQYRRLAEINASGGIGIWVDDIKWLMWAVEQFRRGAKAGVDGDGESYVYFPQCGPAARVAWVLNLAEEDYRCRVSGGRARTS